MHHGISRQPDVTIYLSKCDGCLAALWNRFIIMLITAGHGGKQDAGLLDILGIAIISIARPRVNSLRITVTPMGSREWHLKKTTQWKRCNCSVHGTCTEEPGALSRQMRRLEAKATTKTDRQKAARMQPKRNNQPDKHRCLSRRGAGWNGVTKGLMLHHRQLLLSPAICLHFDSLREGNSTVRYSDPRNKVHASSFNPFSLSIRSSEFITQRCEKERGDKGNPNKASFRTVGSFTKLLGWEPLPRSGDAEWPPRVIWMQQRA
ncbi:hypothetical protein NPIL_233691 [Nephila pilipes]|uniref:Uncharacterized protein n=1 Tax=Nephila pilipes TaxID=299642 RepID=A0A8X6PW40_NEPPI|nr:hypothetical protein NPIL_233691 [Nephila pilipes]